jgi:hypothetical protein
MALSRLCRRRKTARTRWPALLVASCCGMFLVPAAGSGATAPVWTGTVTVTLNVPLQTDPVPNSSYTVTYQRQDLATYTLSGTQDVTVYQATMSGSGVGKATDTGAGGCTGRVDPVWKWSYSGPAEVDIAFDGSQFSITPKGVNGTGHDDYLDPSCLTGPGHATSVDVPLVLPPEIDKAAPVATQQTGGDADHLTGTQDFPWQHQILTGTLTVSWNLSRSSAPDAEPSPPSTQTIACPQCREQIGRGLLPRAAALEVSKLCSGGTLHWVGWDDTFKGDVKFSAKGAKGSRRVSGKQRYGAVACLNPKTGEWFVRSAWPDAPMNTGATAPAVREVLARGGKPVWAGTVKVCGRTATLDAAVASDGRLHIEARFPYQFDAVNTPAAIPDPCKAPVEPPTIGTSPLGTMRFAATIAAGDGPCFPGQTDQSAYTAHATRLPFPTHISIQKWDGPVKKRWRGTAC